MLESWVYLRVAVCSFISQHDVTIWSRKLLNGVYSSQNRSEKLERLGDSGLYLSVSISMTARWQLFPRDTVNCE